jgi:hypothetical protein
MTYRDTWVCQMRLNFRNGLGATILPQMSHSWKWQKRCG